MSPSASGSTTVLDQRNGDDGPQKVSLGLDGPGGGARNNQKRPMPHIDDILTVSVDLNDTTPIEKVIQTATTYLDQAMSMKNFGRPDLALRDYVRAMEILTKTIQRNKGWVMLQRDNKPQLDRYERLLAKLKASRPEFVRIMNEIIADNKISGVQQAGHRREQNGAVGDRPTTSTKPDATSTVASVHAGVSGRGSQYEKSESQRAAPVPRTKPAVHPKPQALHGNALKQGVGSGPIESKTAQDLAQRFANLRANTANGPQDPRIRTQPITSQDSTPRNSLKQPRLDTSVADDVSLPKMPEAIYSPARGTVSSEAAQLPSSTPRGIFSRTSSTVSSVGTLRSTMSPTPEDFFASAQACDTRGKPTIPDTNTIKVDELVNYMKAGSKEMRILLIDVRPREDYQNGHIMSQATICIEPDVLLRPDPSASDIADSLVLGSHGEEDLFRSRHSFDIAVIYDEASQKLPSAPKTREDKAIVSLFNALSLYDYESRSGRKVRPKLLEGGVEAWIQVMGGNSLETSGPANSSPSRATDSTMFSSFRARQNRFVARPIQNADEARQWREQMEDTDAFAPALARTPEEYLQQQAHRRFPVVGDMHGESMSSPVFLPPPTRPAPALSRPSHSGLAESDDIGLAMTAGAAGSSGGSRRRPGLINPGNWCYANSVLQALFSTRGFSEELSSGTWLQNYQVPKKALEMIPNPQLMARCLQSLFYLLQDGKAESVQTSVLMRYVKFLAQRRDQRKDERQLLGGPNQQDASEFYDFIMHHLDDETNQCRDVSSTLSGQFEAPTDTKDEPLLEPTISLALKYWRAYSKTNSSMLDRYFRSLEVETSTCKSCGHQMKTFIPFSSYFLHIPQESGTVFLSDLIKGYFSARREPDARCNRCKSTGRTIDKKIARLPDRLIFVLNRFVSVGGNALDAQKNGCIVQFPFSNLNIAPHFINDLSQPPPQDDAYFNPSPDLGQYDLYAVVSHVGNTITSGHYISYVKDHRNPSGDWFYCSDTTVSQMTDMKNINQQRKLFGSTTDSEAAYMLFYERNRKGP